MSQRVHDRRDVERVISATATDVKTTGMLHNARTRNKCRG
jgi:hypothetical protein